MLRKLKDVGRESKKKFGVELFYLSSGEVS